METAAPDEKRLIIVSGLSGSGKSVALHALEDLGYYCIDNMPAALLKSLVNEVSRNDDNSPVRIAVGVDARNRRQDLETLPQLIDDLRKNNVRTDFLFLQASDEILLKRYSETRRRHPLDKHGTELRTAIEQEREILGQVINSADLIIDTSRTSVYELAEAIRKRVDNRGGNMLSVHASAIGIGVPYRETASAWPCSTDAPKIPRGEKPQPHCRTPRPLSAISPYVLCCAPDA